MEGFFKINFKTILDDSLIELKNRWKIVFRLIVSNYHSYQDIVNNDMNVQLTQNRVNLMKRRLRKKLWYDSNSSDHD